MNDKGKMVIDKLKNTRILAIIGIIGVILGTVVPYISIWFYDITLFDYWQGKVIMFLAIVDLLFIFKDYVEKYVPALFDTPAGKKVKEWDKPKYTLVPTIIIALISLWLTVSLGRSFKYYTIGFYLLWIGTICLIVYAILNKNSYRFDGDKPQANTTTNNNNNASVNNNEVNNSQNSVNSTSNNNNINNSNGNN